MRPSIAEVMRTPSNPGDAMNSLIRRLLTITGSFLVGLSTLLAARPASAGVPDVWAFAYNDTLAPLPGSVMNPAYQWGSFQTFCPGSMATITQITTGKYMVRFPCSASSNGIVHVTAVDDNARYCEIESWGDAAGGDKVVTVLCFKGPARDDSKFTVMYTRSSGAAPIGAHAYVYSDPTGFPISNFNSAGPANSITHLGTGRWEVKLPLLSTGTYDGDLQATAVHPNDAPRRCKIDNWFNSFPDYRVLILCTDPNGVLIDTWFTMSYHFQRSVVATVPGSFAYMTNLPGAPAGSSFNSVGLPNSFAASPPGRYRMSYPGVGTGRTHMQVTALSGAPGTYCQLEKIWMISGGPPGNVDAPVICFNNVGVTTNNLLFSTFSSHL
jgi:hypothetical protein